MECCRMEYVWLLSVTPLFWKQLWYLKDLTYIVIVWWLYISKSHIQPWSLMMFCVFVLYLFHILHLTLFPISSHGFTCFLPPVTPMSWCCMQFLVFSNFVASLCTSSSHPLLSFLAGLLPQRVFNPYVKTNLSNLFYNLLFLQNRNILTARTMYSVALLLQLVVNTHCCVAQYVTRSSTIWTA